MKNMKTKTLKQIGYRISGTTNVKLWGGPKAQIEMNAFDIIGTLTTKKIQNGINDGGFGVESILGAEVTVCELYENDYIEYKETKYVTL